VSRDTLLDSRLLTTLFQYISIKDKGKIGDILNSWPHKSEARISVVTDGVSGLTFSFTLASKHIRRVENLGFGRSRS
jgi:hypothetical protein